MADVALSWKIHQGDASERLRELPDESVQTCITSPPYFGLRDYGIDGQIGLESAPDEYTQALVGVFREVRRVLRADGTLWLNLGDSYNAYNGNRGQSGGISRRSDVARPGFPSGTGLTAKDLKHKDLIGIPWLVAFALQADGWWLRSDIIWAKPNPMPESVTDRPTRSHEYLFLLAKSARYFYDADAIREPHDERYVQNRSEDSFRGSKSESNDRRDRSHAFVKRYSGTVVGNPAGRNKRSVWTITTKPYAEAHFATFPPDLVEPCVLAGSRVDDTVLDPFAGAGTSGLVALRHNRSFIGIELNPDYCELARRRIREDGPLFNVASEVGR